MYICDAHVEAYTDMLQCGNLLGGWELHRAKFNGYLEIQRCLNQALFQSLRQSLDMPIIASILGSLATV